MRGLHSCDTGGGTLLCRSCRVWCVVFVEEIDVAWFDSFIFFFSGSLVSVFSLRFAVVFAKIGCENCFFFFFPPYKYVIKGVPY